MVGSPQLGFGLKKFVKKAAKGAYKYSGTKLVVKSNVALAKVSTKLALLPLKYLLKAAMVVGRTLCKAPMPVLQAGATAANVDPAFIPLFCLAVKENKFSLGSVRRLLPPALKIAAKMAAAGMFPPIVPVLAVVKRMPYVGKFADAGDVDTASAANPALQNAMRALEILALADHLGMLDEADAEAMGLGLDDRSAMQQVLAGAVEASGTLDKEAMVLGGVTAGAAVLGFYLLFR